ncbi:hypothetical protein TL16_g09051 [Triparma laevis f. inornata]|uniref:Uncharacterized protein n=2 Tax=Triparma laevis TaxID=1534972 RepID=A0A9W7AFR4_9STRA|nr:hypothetical protein TrLO_g4971 [Triparma laevis f. longispina]GMH81804.1 hypothetical protein TL16_g09051 [Triparma laevis f. inornata]
MIQVHFKVAAAVDGELRDVIDTSVKFSRSSVSVSSTLLPISCYATLSLALTHTKFPTHAKWRRAQRYVVEVVGIGNPRRSFSNAVLFERVQYKRRVKKLNMKIVTPLRFPTSTPSTSSPPGWGNRASYFALSCLANRLVSILDSTTTFQILKTTSLPNLYKTVSFTSLIDAENEIKNKTISKAGPMAIIECIAYGSLKISDSPNGSKIHSTKLYVKGIKKKLPRKFVRPKWKLNTLDSSEGPRCTSKVVQANQPSSKFKNNVSQFGYVNRDASDSALNGKVEFLVNERGHLKVRKEDFSFPKWE